MHAFNAATLTPAQLDGIACIVCADEAGPMIPVGHVDGGQIFAHRICADEDSAPILAPALLVGPCSSPADVDDLRAYGFDVCDQMGVPVVVTTSADVDVRDFSAVFVYEPIPQESAAGCMDPVAALLEGEAYLYGVPVVRQQSVCRTAVCDACGQVQTVAAVRNEYGEVFCADCRGEAVGCMHCLDDTVTCPVDVDGAWAPVCRPCVEMAERVTGRVYVEVSA